MLWYTVSSVLHNINNTIANGFYELTPHVRTITVALDMSKVFDIVNIHILQENFHTHHKHYYQVHSKLHQKTQIICNIQRTHINITPI